MSVWRRKALVLFPEARREIEDPRANIYLIFMLHALPDVRRAHEEEDAGRLKGIYGFAEWCLRQKAKDVWNAAGVSFYEHLFDRSKSEWPQVVPWLSQYVVGNCAGLWEWRLGEQNYEELRGVLERHGRTAPPAQPVTTAPTPTSRRPERTAGPRRRHGRRGPG